MPKKACERPLDESPLEEGELVTVNAIGGLALRDAPGGKTLTYIADGTVISRLEKAKNKAIIIDETYANYTDKTFAHLINEYDNVFITRSFSKDFALAGMRLGCVISNKNNIINLKKVISPFSVNSLAMKAGIEALNDYQYFKNIKS